MGDNQNSRKECLTLDTEDPMRGLASRFGSLWIQQYDDVLLLAYVAT